MSTKNIKCPVDGRLFATKKALKQHNVAAHSNGPTRPSRSGSAGGQKWAKSPSGSGMPRNPKGFNSMSLSGTDLLGSVTISQSDKSGKLLLAWDVNPTVIANSRLAQMAQTFARWRPRKMQVSAHPGMGVLTPGSYAMGWVADPNWSLGDSSSRLQRLMTLTPSLLSSFGTPRTLVLPMETSQKWYFTNGGDEKETTHGMVIAVLAGLVGGNNLTINFRLDWSIDFSSAEVPVVGVQSETYPDPQFVPCFTDATNDWAKGEHLTIKHAAGGQVVPWIGARSDMVYTPASGTVIPYYDKDSKPQTVGFFAVIGGDYPSGMACFATEEDAKSYVKNHDYSKVIKWTKDGEYATPLLPTLVGKSVEEIALDLRLKTLRVNEAKVRTAETLRAYLPPDDGPTINFRGGPVKSKAPRISIGATADATFKASYSPKGEPTTYFAKGGDNSALSVAVRYGDDDFEDLSGEI